MTIPTEIIAVIITIFSAIITGLFGYIVKRLDRMERQIGDSIANVSECRLERTAETDEANEKIIEKFNIELDRIKKSSKLDDDKLRNTIEEYKKENSKFIEDLRKDIIVLIDFKINEINNNLQLISNKINIKSTTRRKLN